MIKEESIELEIAGERFLVVLLKRPFREGYQVQVLIDGKDYLLPEFGFGLESLRERITDFIKQVRAGELN